MESVASNSSPPPNHRHRRRLGPPPQPITNRIVRALHHRLLLLHRSDDAATFFVLGATANVYAVTLSSTPSCTCPDRATPCKHILFVLIRALGVSLDDSCLRRRTLRPCLLSRLLSSPTLPDSLASPGLRRRFHQLFFHPRSDRANSAAVGPAFEEGTSCPICLEEMSKEERVVACATCRNPIHEECLTRWKRNSGKRAVCCVICRARWREGAGMAAAAVEEEEYLNLAAYVDEDVDNDNVGNMAGGGLCAG
ncbi:Mitogen-activated protein kinase kinase kinase 1 [Morus notabilis]|uniref:Mitogen-activated protein kinase kinase kinase 1 n=1 Tax=Morus notabilis TaxID=981085 RepID=W9RI11_9ROSA|nr:mitogen-activated protein kinase kinase kinase 1 [Morus notabilis]EXB93384.1 Mitogen-activated protein kinase kinase kinase 1 [Morus notabilis]